MAKRSSLFNVLAVLCIMAIFANGMCGLVLGKAISVMGGNEFIDSQQTASVEYVYEVLMSLAIGGYGIYRWLSSKGDNSS